MNNAQKSGFGAVHRGLDQVANYASLARYHAERAADNADDLRDELRRLTRATKLLAAINVAVMFSLVFLAYLVGEMK